MPGPGQDCVWCVQLHPLDFETRPSPLKSFLVVSVFPMLGQLAICPRKLQNFRFPEALTGKIVI